MPVIGLLGPITPTSTASDAIGFRRGLSETGYVEGRNVAIEYRWAGADYARLPALAADLVDRKVDVILALSPPSAHAAKNATPTIPIVFVVGGDPVEEGLIASFARPGGNLTGVTLLAADLTSKRFELLSELVPRASVIGLLVKPDYMDIEHALPEVQQAARAKDVQLHILKANSESEIDAAFDSLVQLRAGGLVVAANPYFYSRRDQLAALAARHAIPAMYAGREHVDIGGLISYGPSLAEMLRQAATYVGRILAGAKPADLPVQQPTRYELVINLITARALGLTVPQLLLARADDLVE